MSLLKISEDYKETPVPSRLREMVPDKYEIEAFSSEVGTIFCIIDTSFDPIQHADVYLTDADIGMEKQDFNSKIMKPIMEAFQ